MYFVDRKNIEAILLYMNETIETIKENECNTKLEMLALERVGHVLIESVLDVGNMMIDGFIMRDPGSYEDIIDILIDERVLPQEQEGAYKEFIGLRKSLVTEYSNVDYQSLEKTLRAILPVLEQFSLHISEYLQNELGVANAFIPHDKV